MRAMILLWWLAIGLAFGGVKSPAAAHGSAAYDNMLSIDGHGVHADNEAHGSDTSDDGAPCHGFVHHHCSIGLASEGTNSLALPVGGDAAHWDVSSAVLSSFAQAPPLEPPSA